jgi:hypothetical protein
MLVEQIKNIVNDAVADALGTSQSISTLDTTDFVSMGKALEADKLYDKWYGSLVNRLTRTIFAVREYNPTSRNILRDEEAFGAFKQKVHYEIMSAVDNPAQKIPQISGNPETRAYSQHSPYDVNTTIGIKALVFGGQGTWSVEVVRPVEQIMSAFTSAADMAAFIDGIYVYIENSLKVQLEAIESAAANTAIARTLKFGKSRNLLTEYNQTVSAGDALTVADCLTSEKFLKFASKEINDTLGYMAKMSTLFNEGAMPKFTPRDRAVVEMLHSFASASEMYLQSSTFHNELVSLPGYNDIACWQESGRGFSFADVSKISIQHDDLIVNATDESDTGTVEQGGIICFIHDIDAVAAFFGYRRTWEVYNERDNVVIHGEQARKGYAVDPNENMIVFYIADASTGDGN